MKKVTKDTVIKAREILELQITKVINDLCFIKNIDDKKARNELIQLSRDDLSVIRSSICDILSPEKENKK